MCTGCYLFAGTKQYCYITDSTCCAFESAQADPSYLVSSHVLALDQLTVNANYYDVFGKIAKGKNAAYT